MLQALALILALSLPIAEAGAQGIAVEEESVAVDYRNGTYLASLTLRVAAPPALALEVLTDFDHMAEFIPNLASSRTVSRNGNTVVVAQQGTMQFGPLSFPFRSERRVERLADGRLIALALSGSANYMRSETRIAAFGAGTRIDYRLELVPGTWLPSTLGAALMRHELAEQFNAVALEIERRRDGGRPR
jgi:carbon monoxide dehydrogenase subunit G